LAHDRYVFQRIRLDTAFRGRGGGRKVVGAGAGRASACRLSDVRPDRGDQWEFRLYAIRFGSDVYRFIFTTKHSPQRRRPIPAKTIT
jgi:hypothetical protein